MSGRSLLVVGSNAAPLVERVRPRGPHDMRRLDLFLTEACNLGFEVAGAQRQDYLTLGDRRRAAKAARPPAPPAGPSLVVAALSL